MSAWLATSLAAVAVLGGQPAQAKHFTVSASGDLLMHQPLLDRARSNAGGGGYDSSATWGYCVVQEMHHSSPVSSVVLISPGLSGSR